MREYNYIEDLKSLKLYKHLEEIDTYYLGEKGLG